MRNKPVSLNCALLCILALPFSPFDAGAKSVSKESETVTISGLVEKPLTITIPSVKLMKVEERKNGAIVCDSGETRQSLKTFKGVLLRDILDLAKVTITNPRERGEYAVLVRSKDSYNVLYSYDELYYGKAGDDTLLVFEENGKPVDKEGPFILFCTSDKVTGPRLVKWVNRIEISKINTEQQTQSCK
jgi:DMSO/TMAO reductase YedYZ molybdopterin-dependent catalytic subunit